MLNNGWKMPFIALFDNHEYDCKYLEYGFFFLYIVLWFKARRCNHPLTVPIEDAELRSIYFPCEFFHTHTHLFVCCLSSCLVPSAIRLTLRYLKNRYLHCIIFASLLLYFLSHNFITQIELNVLGSMAARVSMFELDHTMRRLLVD